MQWPGWAVSSPPYILQYPEENKVDVVSMAAPIQAIATALSNLSLGEIIAVIAMSSWNLFPDSRVGLVRASGGTMVSPPNDSAIDRGH